MTTGTCSRIAQRLREPTGGLRGRRSCTAPVSLARGVTDTELRKPMTREKLLERVARMVWEARVYPARKSSEITAAEIIALVQKHPEAK